MTAAKGRFLDGADHDPTGRRLYAGELATPVAVLHGPALEHNAATMARWCAAHGVFLAPHAKTSMSPELVALQQRHGAWAMTAALPWQAAALWEWGVERVLVANEVVSRRDLAELFRRRAAVPGRELWFYVDDPAGVALAAAAVADAGLDPRRSPATVLVELGHAGGRTGVRGVDAAVALAERVVATEGLRLAGVAGYEGTLATGRPPERLGDVRAYLGELADLTHRVANRGLFAALPAGTPPIVSAGGSVWFDQVADVLGPPAAALGARLVLRSGCYLTHDHRLYAGSSPAAQPDCALPPFVAAIEVWGRVVSRPEPGLALLDAGRRDVSHDAGLPVPVGWSDGDGRRLATDGWTVTGLSDQHTFVAVPPACPLRPGALVGLGVSHPCTTFDRWSRMLLVDDDGVVTGFVHTAF